MLLEFLAWNSPPYIYIYLLSIYITIFSTSLGHGCSHGICQICDLQVLKNILRHFTTDANYFRPCAETNNNGGERKVYMKWIQFRSWFKPSGTKVSSFIIQKFCCFSLSFLSVSVDVVRMFLSCSMK